MGGFFGAISKRDCVLDIFFGVDYHSHLGTKRGGMAIYDAATDSFQREIHNIENTPILPGRQRCPWWSRHRGERRRYRRWRRRRCLPCGQ